MQEQLTNYLQTLFGEQVGLEACPPPGKLPFLYQGLFTYFTCVLRGQRCILALVNDDVHLTPKQAAFHLGQVGEATGRNAILVPRHLGPHDIARYIKMGLPFIVPHRHLFLPFASLVVGPLKKPRVFNAERLSVHAGLLVLGVLLRKIPASFLVTGAEKPLECSHVTARAAMEELAMHGLGRTERRRDAPGSQFTFVLTGKALWETTLPILGNPCRRIVGVETLPANLAMVPAGMDALAERSMLSEQPTTEYAVLRRDWNRLRLDALPAEDADIRLQLWERRPDFFTPGHIDTLSLALSLHNHPDPRVQHENQNTLENFQW